MVEVIWTNSALLDLTEIAEYIALDKVSAANKLVKDVINKTDRLVDFPESGRTLTEFDDDKYREVIVQPCRIIYYIENKNVYIIHVMRSERQLRRYMLEDVIHEKPSKYTT
ncbi:MAG: type II toxin-antitoxin system RelE/ParE family toxin [Marinicellaceae bacterium]